MAKDLFSKIDQNKWIELLDTYGLKKLSDNSVLPEEKDFPLEDSFKLLDGKVTFQAKALAGIALYNKASEKDPLKISNEKASDSLKSPLLKHSQSSPTIRYKVESNLEGEGGIEDLGSLPLSINAEGKLQIGLYSYINHDGYETMAMALVSDRQNLFRTALNYEDVLSLPEGQAIAMAWSGSLGFTAKVNWADIVGSTISELDAVLSAGEYISIKLDAKLETEFAFSIKDTFQLVFARREGTDLITIEARKTNRKEWSMKAGIDLTFNTSLAKQAAEDLSEIKAKIIKAILDIGKEELTEVRTWLASDITATGELKSILLKLQSKLLGEFDSIQEDLKKKLEKWLDDLEKKLTESVKKTIEASISWSYSRVKTNEILARLELAPNRINSLIKDVGHKKLRRGDLSPLQQIIATEGNPANHYLEILTLNNVSKFAMGISIGDWALSWERTKTFTLQIKENAQEEILPTLIQSTEGSFTLGNEIAVRKIGISAEGKDFKPKDKQTWENLNFTLSLSHTNLDGDTEEDEAIDYLDTARIWDAVSLTKDNTMHLADTLSNSGKKLKFITSLSIHNKSFAKIFQGNPNLPENLDLWGDALALAIRSYKYNTNDVLLDLEKRSKAYAKVADYYISEAKRKKHIILKLAKNGLTEVGAGDMAAFEDKIEKASREQPESARIVKLPRGERRESRISNLLNESILSVYLYKKDWRYIFEEIHTKARIIGTSMGDKSVNIDTLTSEFKDFSKLLDRARNRPLLFRALGSFIALKHRKLIREDPEYTNEVERSFQVYEVDSEDKETEVQVIARTE